MLGRCTRILCEVAALTALALLLLTGVATWRLSQGPVPLNFLTGHIENALNDMVRPVRISLQGTNLAWAGWERTLDIRVVGTKISGADGVTIAKVPEMSVSFSLRALLRGVVAPTNLDLIGPRLQVVRNENGKFAFTLEETTNLPTDTLGGVLAALSAPKQDNGILLSCDIIKRGFLMPILLSMTASQVSIGALRKLILLSFARMMKSALRSSLI